MKQMGDCAVCMVSGEEGSVNYRVKIRGKDTGSMHTSVDGAIEELCGLARCGICGR